MKMKIIDKVTLLELNFFSLAQNANTFLSNHKKYKNCVNYIFLEYFILLTFKKNCVTVKEKLIYPYFLFCHVGSHIATKIGFVCECHL